MQKMAVTKGNLQRSFCAGDLLVQIASRISTFDPARHRGERFLVWDKGFAVVIAPTRESLAESRMMKGEWRGRCGDAGRGREGGGTGGCSRDAGRHPVAGSVSRRAAMGIQRGCSRRNRGDDLFAIG